MNLVRKLIWHLGGIWKDNFNFPVFHEKKNIIPREKIIWFLKTVSVPFKFLYSYIIYAFTRGCKCITFFILYKDRIQLSPNYNFSAPVSISGRELSQEEMETRIKELKEEWNGGQSTPKIKMFMMETRTNRKQWIGGKSMKDILNHYPCLEEGPFVSIHFTLHCSI